jgi:hypothetical protein
MDRGPSSSFRLWLNDPAAPQKMAAVGEPLDADRLCERLKHYAIAGGASDAACQQMLDMLRSPLGLAVLALPQQQLDSLLVNDM